MTTNGISTYAKNFAAQLKAGLFYKSPLSDNERQGHHIVASLIEKAADNADILGHMACDFLNTLVSQQTQGDIPTVSPAKKDIGYKVNVAAKKEPKKEPKAPVIKSIAKDTKK